MAHKSVQELQRVALKIFMAGVQAVSPEKLVSDTLTVSNNKLVIKEKEYNLHKNVHVVAFGKAVLGMVNAVEGMLGSHIRQGVASVPYGLQNTEEGHFSDLNRINRTEVNKVEIINGAKDNYPDKAAQNAARKIMEIAQRANQDDILLVLISGGGSALLPLPVDEITLEEKLQTTKVLSKRGASIFELNTVRKHLSQIKGGKLAEAAYPASVITLILSDVIGDPLDIIACGPTVPDSSTKQDCLNILEKLNVLQDIPQNVLRYLKTTTEISQKPLDCSHVYNIVIGNNRIAVNAAALMAESLGYCTLIHSTNVVGEARDVGRFYGNIGITSSLKSTFGAKNVGDFVELCAAEGKPCCILGAGETTVSVKGSGHGGRNQELALGASLELNRLAIGNNILLLSAGTDGQDGPTSAAGAYAFSELVTKATEQGLDPLVFLNNNDSFTFYNQLDDGKYLVKTGLTGTNVMDLQVLLVISP